jgi:rod shape-determining protein MreD
MESVPLRFPGAIVVSLIIAFALTIIPLREEWALWRPEWLALTLIHWGLTSPKKSSLVLAWFFGLMLDAVYGTILGQHALGFSIVLFMTLRISPRILVDGFFQQMFLLFIVLGTYLLINLWIYGITGNPPPGWGYWITVLSSLIVWPLYHYYMRIYHAKKKPFD